MDTTETTITTDVAENMTLRGATRHSGRPTRGTEVRIFADGHLIGIVEIPGDRPGNWLPLLVAYSVVEKIPGSAGEVDRRRTRSEFPDGGGIGLYTDEIDAIERDHADRRRYVIEGRPRHGGDAAGWTTIVDVDHVSTYTTVEAAARRRDAMAARWQSFDYRIVEVVG